MLVAARDDAAKAGSSGSPEPPSALRRLIQVPARAALTMVLALSAVAGCADQGSEADGRGAGDTRHESGIVGLVHLGPQCPVQTESDACKDERAAEVTVTVARRPPGSSGAGRVVATATTDADGRYRVAVPPGTYVVTADAGMSCRQTRVRVRSGASSRADIACDTGIR